MGKKEEEWKKSIESGDFFVILHGLNDNILHL